MAFVVGKTYPVKRNPSLSFRITALTGDIATGYVLESSNQRAIVMPTSNLKGDPIERSDSAPTK